VKAAARTWNEFWAQHWRLIARKSRDTSLARFSAIKDRHTSHLKPFLRFLAENQLNLDFAAVKAYFVHVNSSPFATTTKLNRRAAVKARLRTLLYSPDFTQQAGVEGMLRSLDYGAETRAPIKGKAGVAEDKIVTREEFDLLVANTSRRTSLFLWFLYNTGCRAGEMCGARLDHCEVDRDTVHVRVTGKGNKDRRVDIEKALFEAIRTTFGGDTFLFQTSGGKPLRPSYMSYEITKAARRVLGRRISAHSLRHSFATLTIRDGASVKAVSVYLGHSNVSLTLSMYVHETLEKRQKVMREFKGELSFAFRRAGVR
jgi:integrase